MCVHLRMVINVAGTRTGTKWTERQRVREEMKEGKTG